MASSTNFTEWSREEKDAFAQKRMQEMKLKNEMLMQRHAEVLEDKHKAEGQNSSVKVAVQKEQNVVTEEVPSKKVYEREWDRGKVDLELFNAPDYYDAPHNRKGFNWRTDGREDTWTNSNYTQSKRSNWRTDRRENNWTNSTYTQSKSTQHKHDEYGQNSFSNKRFGPDNRSFRSENRGTTGSNYDRQNLREASWRPRGRSSAAFNSNERNRSNYSRDTEQKHSRTAHSNSSFSDPDTRTLDNRKNPRTGDTWSDDELAENQQKQNRVENWVNSISSSDSWDQKNDPKNACKEKGKDTRSLPSSHKKPQHSYDDTWDNVKPDKGFKQSSYSAHNTYKNSDSTPTDNHNYDKSHLHRQDDNRRSFERNKKYVGQSSKSNNENHGQRYSAQSNSRVTYSHQKRESFDKSKYVEESESWGDVKVDSSKSNDEWLDSKESEPSHNWKKAHHTQNSNAKSNERWMDSSQKEYKNNPRVSHAIKNVNEDDEWGDIDQSHIFENTNSGKKNDEKGSTFDSAKNEYSNRKQHSQHSNVSTHKGREYSAEKGFKRNTHEIISHKNLDNDENEWIDIDQSESFRKISSRKQSVEKDSQSASAENRNAKPQKKMFSSRNSYDKSDEKWLDATEQEYKIKSVTHASKNVTHDVDEWADIDQSDIFNKTNSPENSLVEKDSKVYSEENEHANNWKEPNCAQNNYNKPDEEELESKEIEHMNTAGLTDALKNVAYHEDEWGDNDQSESLHEANSPIKNNENSQFNHNGSDDESKFIEEENVKSYECALQQMEYSDDGFIDDRESKFFEGKEVKLNDNDTIRVVIHLDNTSQIHPINNEEIIDECGNMNVKTDCETSLHLDSCLTSHDSSEEITSDLLEMHNSEMSSVSKNMIVESESLSSIIPEQFDLIQGTNSKYGVDHTELQKENPLSDEEKNSKDEEHFEGKIEILPVRTQDDTICRENDNISGRGDNSASETSGFDERREFIKKNEDIPEKTDNMPNEDRISEYSETFAADGNSALIEKNCENYDIPDEALASTSKDFADDQKSVMEKSKGIPKNTDFKDEGILPDMLESNKDSNTQIVLPDMLRSNQNSCAQDTDFASVNKFDTETYGGDPDIGVQNSNSVCLKQLPKVCTENLSQSLMTSVKFPDLVPIFDAGFSVESAHGTNNSLAKQEYIQSSQSDFEKPCDAIKEDKNINRAERKESHPLQLKENLQDDNENTSALNQSDDGGWSTVSEEADSNAENSDDLIHNTDKMKDLESDIINS